MTSQPRAPKGTPAGGQFGATAHNESDVSLADDRDTCEVLMTSPDFLDVIEKAQELIPNARSITFRKNDDGQIEVGEVLGEDGAVIASRATSMSDNPVDRSRFDNLAYAIRAHQRRMDASGLTDKMPDDGHVAVALPISLSDLNYARGNAWDGMDPEEAADWQNKQFTAQEAQQWGRRGGFSPTEATLWRRTGFNATAAKEWSGSFKVLDAQRWDDSGFTPEHAQVWKEQRFSREQATAWRRAGFGPFQAKAWYKADFTPWQAGRWSEAGYTHTSAAEEEDRYGRHTPSYQRDPTA